jgi:RNA polymerase sigma factor (sigma-70 family)
MSTDWSLSLDPFNGDAAILGFMNGRQKTTTNKRSPAKTTKSAVLKATTKPLVANAEDDVAMCAMVDEIAGDSEEALGRFYDATVSRVYGLALRIVRTPELAEEVTSDVYMQVWRHAVRYDASRGRVLGWLLIIARTRALDLLRKQDEAFSHPDPHDLVTEPQSNRDDPQDLLAAMQSNTTLHAALEELSPLQRQLLALAFFRGLTHSEIVEHTALPLGTVKTHIRRALSVLRERLGDELVCP